MNQRTPGHGGRKGCFCVLAAVLPLLTGCATPETAKPPEPPLSVGNGLGSHYGNYAARPDGEMQGTDGERCVLYNWDRPLGNGMAVRLRSASCESRERPGRMIAHDLSRTIIPLSQSNLKDGEEE